MFAIAVPFIPGLAVVIMIGVVLVVSGVSHIAHAFQCRNWKGVVFELLSGLLYLLVGIMLFTRPGAGLAAFTLVLSILIMMEGAFEIAMSFQVPKEAGKGMMLFNGIIGLLLGFLIWTRWPVSAVWFIGTLIGISMIFKGWSAIWLSMAVKKIPAGTQAT